MRSCLLVLTVAVVLFFSAATFAQTDRGTFTGIVTDASGALIPGAAVRATNLNTSVVYETVTTETGNYSIAQAPAGQYALTVELPGFRTYIREGIRLQAAQTVRIDVKLEVGAVTDSITITADAPLLQTESGEISTNVTSERLNELPILPIGSGQAGSAGVRNPLAVAQLVPGAWYLANNEVVINGSQDNKEMVRIDGQDSTSYGNLPAAVQPSVDAMQEVTILASNFAAEYGQTGGPVFSYTTRSGGNEIHGSIFNTYVNEFLNAGKPFQPLGPDGKKPREGLRANNYGGNVGGPVVIPGLYDGHNRTFFFFNVEEFRQRTLINSQQFTLPTEAMRNGDFSSIITGRVLGRDPLGRNIIEGTLYDPATQRLTADGQIVRDPFPGNIIPRNRMDPVALKVQSFLPPPSRPGPVNNFLPSFEGARVTTIPSIKVDHSWRDNFKMSFYRQATGTGSQYDPERGGADGLPPEVTTSRGTFIEAHEERLNFDWTVSPRLLLHFGIGYQGTDFKDTAPTARQDPSSDVKNGAFADPNNPKVGFNALEKFGLPGAQSNLALPFFSGLTGPSGSGGSKNLGTNAQRRELTYKPGSVVTAIWVKNNHTYKFGGDYTIQGHGFQTFTSTAGQFAFSVEQTGLGTLQNLGGGFVGHPYASFLLGLVDNGQISRVANYRTGKQALAFYAQDTWKVSPTFTLDYGLRWDWIGNHREQYGRLPNFDPNVINSQTGTPGGVIFEGDFSPAHCQCAFASTYKNAGGPRLGMSWQVRPAWVVRGGVGISYAPTAERPGGIASLNPFDSPVVGQAAIRLQDGPPTPRPWPFIDSGLGPLPGGLQFVGTAVDPRPKPPRQVSFSLAVQKEITPNFTVEAAYVGNRGVWWEANGLRNLNANTPERLAVFGLDPTNAADFALLRARVDSPLAIGRGFGPNSRFLPYRAGVNGATISFPASATVAQMLRPFPQFGNIGAYAAPLGKTWYDALQMKAIKRVSHGLDFTWTFSWQKELAIGVSDTPVNNSFDYGSNKTVTGNSRPLVMVFAGNYRVPQFTNMNRALSWVLRDWQIGAVMQYASGQPLNTPNASTNLNSVLFQGESRAGRVEGVNPFTKDLNCHCYDPLKTFVLNPKAWQNPAVGKFGGPVFYGDYRQMRRPNESMSFGRVFPVREGVTLSVRAEFTNMFNRAPYDLTPTETNFGATQRTLSDGTTTGGFGRIDPALGPLDLPRQGSIVARIRF